SLTTISYSERNVVLTLCSNRPASLGRRFHQRQLRPRYVLSRTLRRRWGVRHGSLPWQGVLRRLYTPSNHRPESGLVRDALPRALHALCLFSSEPCSPAAAERP